MRARDVREHFQSVGTWVDWQNTVDQFLHADPEAEVRGIATAWIGTNAAFREAHRVGANLFVTHEPVFLPGYAETESGSAVARRKRQLLEDLGLTVLRCHDTWDRMPEVGIPDAWTAWLGFESDPRPTDSFYRLCHVDGRTVEEVAQRVGERIASLGQRAPLIFGHRDRAVSRMAVGTGAITWLPAMHELGADLLLATDDGMNAWDGGLWAADLDIPLIIVNHAVAEKPGMMALADYLRDQFPDVPTEYIDTHVNWDIL
jgi:putative NIF3 family GTP cyclohydrolase 1 type 2